MQRKGVWLPRECYTRPYGHLEGGLGNNAWKVKALREMARLTLNLSLFLIKPYHFDNIADFLDNEDNLERGVPLVFPELKVKSNRLYIGSGRLELVLGDNSGTLNAIYDWVPTIGFDHKAGDIDTARDVFYNPLHGAESGDTLKIYSAMYVMQGTIKIEDHFRVLNDKHYQRVKEMREKVLREQNSD